MRSACVALLLLACSACRSDPGSTCDPATCSGCCLDDGRCTTGTVAQACGSGGGACQACSAGTECLLGLCVAPPPPSDGGSFDAGCLLTGCGSGQLCDSSSGTCTVRCPTGADNECPQPGFCNPTSKLCGCSPGTHLCGTACVPNTDLATCGNRCAPCPVPTVGSATCDGTSCGLSCPSTHRACGRTCAPCPAGATATTCDGEQCVATACQGGRRLCSGQCDVCPTDALQTGCSGARCVATACPGGAHECNGQCASNTSVDSCGSSCAPCPEPAANGSATCDGTQCSITCTNGLTNCGTACTTCPSVGVATTGCAGNTCVATACAAGYRVCNGACAACPEGAATTSCTAGRCVATACQAPFRLCGESCCGLRTVKAEGLAMNGPVGAASAPDAGPVFAWDNTYYGNGLQVAGPGTDGGLGARTTVGGTTADGLELLVDGAGTEHLVFVLNVTNGDDSLRHAWRSGGAAWQTETALTSSGVLLEAAAGVTTSGDLRVVFSDNLASKLRYVEKNGSTWTAPVDVPLAYAARGFAVTVDAQGRAHVLSPTSTGLQYAFGNAATLAAGPSVTTASVFGVAPALALNGQGEVTAAWVQGGNLLVSTLQGSAWTAPSVIAQTSLEKRVALAFDPAGFMHLLFHGCPASGSCSVRYAAQAASGWAFQTLRTPQGLAISPTHLAITAWAPGVAAGVCATLSDGAWVFTP